MAAHALIHCSIGVTYKTSHLIEGVNLQILPYFYRSSILDAVSFWHRRFHLNQGVA